MKERILTGWTFRRVLYLAVGIILVIQSIMDNDWLIALPGIYFASMGLFAFGCASGNCALPPQRSGATRQKPG